MIKSTKPKSSVYLLIGCWQNDDDLLVVRAAQCPDAAEDIVAEVCVRDCCFFSIFGIYLKDLSSAPAMDAEWIVDHACRLIRILPGGLDIVGELCADIVRAFNSCCRCVSGRCWRT